MSECDIIDAISELRGDIKRIERSINGRPPLTQQEKYSSTGRLMQEDNKNIMSQLDKIIELLTSIDSRLRRGISVD